MTHPKDPQADIDEQLNLLWDCFYPFDKAKTLDRWRTLVQAHQQELLSELLGELPTPRDIEELKKETDLVGWDDDSSRHFGFNEAINQVVSVIERYREEL